MCGDLVVVRESSGLMRGYAMVPEHAAESEEFEVTSASGDILEFDSPGFPLFERLARSRGAYEDDFIPEGFDRWHWRSVRGRPCWIGCWALTFFLGSVVPAWLAPPKRLLHMLAMYCLTFIASLLFVLSSWWEHRRELEAGVLVSIFWTSGTIGVGCAAALNYSVLHIWPLIDPHCHPLHPLGAGWPEEPPSIWCMAKSSVEWMLMAGLIEESVKFIVLLRLLPSPEAAADCQLLPCCCRRRRSSRPGRCRLVCGQLLRSSWFRLAPTPYAFAIASLASGAGLATTENFHYIFFDTESFQTALESGDLTHALGRIISTCAHILWTGLAGIHLARWHFLPAGHPDRPRFRWTGMLVPIVSHGLFDACAVLRTCYPEEHCMEWPPGSDEWVCGHCVLQPGPRLVVGVLFQILFCGTGFLFHHRWYHTLLELSVEASCGVVLLADPIGD